MCNGNVAFVINMCIYDDDDGLKRRRVEVRDVSAKQISLVIHMGKRNRNRKWNFN